MIKRIDGYNIMAYYQAMKEKGISCWLNDLITKRELDLFLNPFSKKYWEYVYSDFSSLSPQFFYRNAKDIILFGMNKALSENGFHNNAYAIGHDLDWELSVLMKSNRDEGEEVKQMIEYWSNNFNYNFKDYIFFIRGDITYFRETGEISNMAYFPPGTCGWIKNQIKLRELGDEKWFGDEIRIPNNIEHKF